MKTLVSLIILTALSVMCYAQQKDYNVNPWVTKHFHKSPGEVPGTDYMKPPYKVRALIHVGFHLNPTNTLPGIDGIDPWYCRTVSKAKLVNQDHISPEVIARKGRIGIWNPNIDGLDPWYCRPIGQAKTVIHR